MKQCPECGENLADDAVHCGHCGTKVEDEEGDGGKTMFGMGALTDEELEQFEEGEGDDSGGGSGDEEDGGFRLPRPSEMGEGASGGQSEEAASEEGDGERLGLKGPSSDSDDPSAYADTEALPSLEEKSGKQQDASDDLKGGRLSTPSPERQQKDDLEASPDLSSESSPPSQEGSPFVDGENQPQTTQQQGARSGGGSGGKKPSTPQTETPEANEPAAADDGATEEMPETADMISSPEDQEREKRQTPGGEDQHHEKTPAQAPETDPDETAAEQPSSKAAASTEGTGTGPGASPAESSSERSPSEPAVESSGAAEPQQATAEREDDQPSRSPLADDQRFGGGTEDSDQPMQEGATGQEVGERELDMQQPQTSADSGSDQKTLLIIGAILFASFFMCGGGIFLAWWFGLI